MDRARVRLVVPTLGRRLEFLEQCLTSIQVQAVSADIVMVCPTTAIDARTMADRLGVSVLDDPGSLPGAINRGIEGSEGSYDYVSWLGDDDLLEPDSLTLTVSLMDAHLQAVLAYGACRYIDERGDELWISRAGAWARRILSWGPDLIPQPGMLVRSSAWSAVGGLDESLSMAFDLDLLLKLKSQGPFVHTSRVVSSFRWHGDSLTASDRSRNLDESEDVKRRYLGPIARRAAWLWERPVRQATVAAAREVHRRRRVRSSINR